MKEGAKWVSKDLEREWDEKVILEGRVVAMDAIEGLLVLYKKEEEKHNVKNELAWEGQNGQCKGKEKSEMENGVLLIWFGLHSMGEINSAL